MAIDQEQLIKDAQEGAEHEVMGFVLHDRKEYEKAGCHFGWAYLIIDRYRPPGMLVGEERARKAGKHKIEALKAYDGIVEAHEINVPFTHSSIEEYPNYAVMIHHVEEECKAFGIPDVYGFAKVRWYRTHAEWVRSHTGTGIVPEGYDYPFIPDLNEAESIFVGVLTGDNELYLKTVPLFLECVRLHNHRRIYGLSEHDPDIIEGMKNSYGQYLTLLFERMQLNIR